ATRATPRRERTKKPGRPDRQPGFSFLVRALRLGLAVFGRALAGRRLVRHVEFGLDVPHPLLELLDPAPDPAANFWNPLRSEDEEHDQEEPEKLLGSDVEHVFLPPLRALVGLRGWLRRLSPAPRVPAHDNRDVDHLLGRNL